MDFQKLRHCAFDASDGTFYAYDCVSWATCRKNQADESPQFLAVTQKYNQKDLMMHHHHHRRRRSLSTNKITENKFSI